MRGGGEVEEKKRESVRDRVEESDRERERGRGRTE